MTARDLYQLIIEDMLDEIERLMKIKLTKNQKVSLRSVAADLEALWEVV